jgi:flagellar basal-body rod protein FlgB
MTDMFSKDANFQLLTQAMDVAARRNRLISDNIANMDTVGYRPKDLDFQKSLKRAMQDQGGFLTRTNPKHFRRESATGADDVMVGRKTGPFDMDPVNIDVEMTHLAENNLQYKTSAELLLRKLAILKNAIIEGGH